MVSNVLLNLVLLSFPERSPSSAKLVGQNAQAPQISLRGTFPAFFYFKRVRIASSHFRGHVCGRSAHGGSLHGSLVDSPSKVAEFRFELERSREERKGIHRPRLKCSPP